MAALIKLGLSRYLGVATTTIGSEGFTSFLPAGDIELVGAPKGEPESSGLVIKKDQTVLIRPAVGAVNPSKYHVIVGFNPLLLKSGIVSSPGITLPRIENICLQFTAKKNINLEKLGHVFELSLLD